MYDLGYVGKKRLRTRDEDRAYVFKRIDGYTYRWCPIANKIVTMQKSSPAVGSLIRDQNNPQYINIVHKMETIEDQLIIYSTRLFHIAGSELFTLPNNRAKPFDWNRARWEVVKQYKYQEVDNSDICKEALNRSFEMYKPQDH